MTSEPTDDHDASTPAAPTSRWTKITASYKKLVQRVTGRHPGFDGDLPQAYRVDPEDGEKRADEFCKSR
jgi:hypothetical protein